MNTVKLLEGIETSNKVCMGMIFRQMEDNYLYLMTGVGNGTTYLLHNMSTGNCWNSNKNYIGKTVEEMGEMGFELVASEKIEITIE